MIPATESPACAPSFPIVSASATAQRSENVPIKAWADGPD